MAVIKNLEKTTYFAHVKCGRFCVTARLLSQVDEMEKLQKGGRSGATPVLFKQSPRVPPKTSAKNTSVKQVPRGLSARSTVVRNLLLATVLS